jgi:hypothetical protein
LYTPVRAVVGRKDDTDELFFCREMSVISSDGRRGWCRERESRLTINPSRGSPVFLPDECKAHDDHYYSIDNAGYELGGPDAGLIWGRRHGEAGQRMKSRDLK